MTFDADASAAQLDAQSNGGEVMTYRGKGAQPKTITFIALRPGGSAGPSPADVISQDEALLEAFRSDFPKKPQTGEDITGADGTTYRITRVTPTPISFRLTCTVNA